MIRCIRCNKRPVVPIWIGEIAYCNSCANQEVKNLKAENKRLKAENVELLEDAFREIAIESPDGWFDSCGRSTACDYGDKLVELGLWEKRPCGVGRRQWYRPKSTGGGE